MPHTPGPWTIAYETEDGEIYDDGVRIDSPEGPVAFNVIDCSAHLIAAAPELYAALQEAVRALNTAKRFRVGDTDSYAIAALCDKAIQKADRGCE